MTPGLEPELAAARSRAEEAVARADQALEVAHDASLAARMLAFMSWLEMHDPPTGPPLSVIIAAWDRPRRLARAIDSVLAQRYERWQLVVVADADTDAVARALADVEDERIVTVEGPRRGSSAARNRGLEVATGEVICYLDDDNIMHPGWLHAVAHVFSRRENVDVIYGVSLAEHRLPDDLSPDGWWPSFWQLPWSRATLLKENVSDTGSIAHRRGLPEARFDVDLRYGEDWDILLRLTADREPLAVPALSHAYAMAGTDRKSRDPRRNVELEEIRQRHAGSLPSDDSGQ